MRHTASEQGILRPDEAAKHIDLRRYRPDQDLGRFVERFWTVHWDLRAPYDVRLISHPCVNITVLPVVGAQLHGVGTTTSTHGLAGTGMVFGVKFRPGGFRAFTGLSAASFTDRSVQLRDVLGSAADDLADAVLTSSSDTERADKVSTFLRGRMPGGDDNYDLLLRVIGAMLDDRTITRVEHAARRFGLSVRTVQRLFRQYVGVGPKWVIMRYRLHDAAERLARGEDVTTVAIELGWFDQAHFTKDFTALIGTSPAAYAAACAATDDREPVAVLPTV